MNKYTVQPKSRFQKLVASTLIPIAVVLICFFWTLPTFGLLVSSFRNKDAITNTSWWSALNPFAGTGQWTFENYSEVLNAVSEGSSMSDAFLNSFVVTIPAAVIPIIMAAFAAYAFAWMKFRGRDVMFALVVVFLFVPWQLVLIPLLKLYTGWELTGTFLGIWLIHTAFALPLAIYFFYTSISRLPKEMFESARMDGASHYTVFARLVLPLSLSPIVSFAIFQFLWVWNDYLVTKVFLSQTYSLVTIFLANLVGTQGEKLLLLTAGTIISMSVPLLVLLLTQRHLIRELGKFGERFISVGRF